jgi:hypothetical protein
MEDRVELANFSQHFYFPCQFSLHQHFHARLSSSGAGTSGLRTKWTQSQPPLRIKETPWKHWTQILRQVLIYHHHKLWDLNYFVESMNALKVKDTVYGMSVICTSYTGSDYLQGDESLWSCQSLSYSRSAQHFMKPESPLPSSQEKYWIINYSVHFKMRDMSSHFIGFAAQRMF